MRRDRKTPLWYEPWAYDFDQEDIAMMGEDEAAIVVQVRELYRKGVSVEEAIHVMRCADLGKMNSIRLLRQEFHLPLGEAKQAVHLSPVWADVKSAHDALHEEVIRSFTEKGQNATAKVTTTSVA